MATATIEMLLANYADLPAQELDRRIARAKDELGARLVILGHHYQRDEVVKFADYRGDSLRLSQLAARRPEAEYIVFCGVHFMAESADILSGDHQTVILPDLQAGCSMADMANLEQVEVCWEALTAANRGKIIPVTYINSTAAIKAFVGRNDGAVCTSSNARKVMEWAQARGEKALFLPDEHLGRNTGYGLGIPLKAMAVWNPQEEDGGLTGDQTRDARIYLWKGHCSVHMRFRPEHVERARLSHPGIRVIAHPECSWEVCQAADEVGSTEYILKRIVEAPPGSAWAVGTEIHMIRRMAREHPDRLIVSLDDCVCMCSTMFRISPQHLCWTLESLRSGQVINRVSVDPETKRWALVALNRMLEIK
jgi:quinolinate synthase